MKNKLRTIPYLLLLVVIMLLIYLCIYFPWLGDDTCYMFNFATGDLIKNFRDIIISQNEHYFCMNGRYVAHLLVQVFCGLSNHIVFAICNGLVFVMFVMITLRLAGVRFSNIALSIVGVVLCFLGFQTRMVPSCQICYMWMFTLTMMVIWFYLYKPQVKKCWWWILLPFCVVAGWGQEALNVGVCGAMILYTLQNRKSVTVTQLAILFAYGFGTLLLIVSPGSHHRLTELHGTEESFQITHNIILFLKYVCVTYVLMGVLAVGIISKRLNLLQCFKQNAFYWNIFIICFIMNLYISIFCNRQLFGMELAALILTLKVLRSMEYRKLNQTLVAVVLALLAWVGYHNIITVNAFSKDYDDVMAAYRSSKDGIVFMDFRKKSQPLPCRFTIDEFQNEWVIRWANRLLKSDSSNNGKSLIILPTAFYPLSTSNAYTIGSNNILYVMCNAKNISSFSVKRHVEFFGKRFSHQEYTVNTKEDAPLYRIGDMSVYIITSASWKKIDTVVFHP